MSTKRANNFSSEHAPKRQRLKVIFPVACVKHIVSFLRVEIKNRDLIYYKNANKIELLFPHVKACALPSTFYFNVANGNKFTSIMFEHENIQESEVKQVIQRTNITKIELVASPTEILFNRVAVWQAKHCEEKAIQIVDMSLCKQIMLATQKKIQIDYSLPPVRSFVQWTLGYLKPQTLELNFPCKSVMDCFIPKQIKQLITTFSCAILLASEFASYFKTSSPLSFLKVIDEGKEQQGNERDVLQWIEHAAPKHMELIEKTNNMNVFMHDACEELTWFVSVDNFAKLQLGNAYLLNIHIEMELKRDEYSLLHYPLISKKYHELLAKYKNRIEIAFYCNDNDYSSDFVKHFLFAKDFYEKYALK